MAYIEEIVKYLDEKKVKESSYRKFLIDTGTTGYCFQAFTINDSDYIVSHFFDCSNRLGYGLVATNNILHCPSNHIAIGLLEGDDVICLNVQSNKICLWFIQTGHGECIQTEMSFKEFIKVSTIL